MKTAIISFVLFVCLNHVFAQTNFSGTWKINNDQSDFGQLSKESAAPAMLKVTQSSALIYIEKTFAAGPAAPDSLSFDGKIVSSTLPHDTKKFASCKWSEDRKSLKVIVNYKVENDNPFDYNKTETWTLSDDGKRLNVLRVTTLPDRTETIKAVYDKQ